ncbi:MAG: DUF1343 domain-containing protein [Desulfobacteraceae bacterium]|nr:DUF1343 domain-containing protein [Desulfobacteraceae bacterium]
MSNKDFLLGCEVLLQSPPPWLRSGRLGLLANQASVGSSLKHVKDLIREAGGRLSCLFSPQHGFFSEKQANMIESPDGRDPDLEIPVVSLYSGTRQPSADDLGKIDVLLVDLQDVGTRVYTYLVTMGLCIEAAAKAGTKVVVLDRPNPIGGTEIEGNALDVRFRSFVGRYPIPMRHGLTPGEYARFVQSEEKLECDLEVFAMRGWRRRSMFDSLGLQWVFPSPNMPSWETALLYPGMVLLEGTNISEGRGTTLPFHIFGAPFLDRRRVLDHLGGAGLEGTVFRPLTFEPAFDKYRGESCSGFQIHVTDRKRFRPYRLGLAIIRALREVHPERFAWLDPPYEYEWEKLPIDILVGSEEVRRKIEAGTDLDVLEAEWQPDLNRFRENRSGCLLYEE